MLVAGKACLILALGCCLYGIAASVYGARTRRREWVDSGRRLYLSALDQAKKRAVSRAPADAKVRPLACEHTR